MLVSLFSIALNFCLNWTLTFHLGLGHKGLALSTSVVALTNFALLYIMMRRYAGRLETGVVFRDAGEAASWAGACLGAVCWLGSHFFFTVGFPRPRLVEARRRWDDRITGALVFFGAAYLLRVAELHDLVDCGEAAYRAVRSTR